MRIKYSASVSSHLGWNEQKLKTDTKDAPRLTHATTHMTNRSLILPPVFDFIFAIHYPLYLWFYTYGIARVRQLLDSDSFGLGLLIKEGEELWQ